MVNDQFMAHARMEQERATLTSSEARSATGGAPAAARGA